MSIKKRIWCWIIAGLLVAVGAGLYYGIPHFSRWVSERRVTAPNTADLGAEEKPAETPDKPAIKRGWSSKSIGVVVGLTVGGAFFLVVRRKQQLAKKAKGSLEPGLGVTTPAPTPPATPPATNPGTAPSRAPGEPRKCWWNPNLDPVAKAVWQPLSLALVIFLLAIGTVVARPTWHGNVEAWSGDPQVWGITLLALALLVLAIRSKFYTALGWLLALGLVGLIVFLMVDTFGADTKKAWDNTWRNDAPAPASASSVTVEITTPAPRPTDDRWSLVFSTPDNKRHSLQRVYAVKLTETELEVSYALDANHRGQLRGKLEKVCGVAYYVGDGEEAGWSGRFKLKANSTRDNFDGTWSAPDDPDPARRKGGRLQLFKE